MEILKVAIDVLLYILKCCWIIGKSTFRLIVPVGPKPVKGEIVLITGAASGIGRELALQYASKHAIVVCWDINEKENLETANMIEKLGYPKAHAYVCDVTKREKVMETAKKVQNEVGNVTILINNAGIMPHRSFTSLTADDFQRTIDINLMGNFWTIQAFLPIMVKNNHGHIVAMTSGASLIGIKHLIPYCASKFAVRGMMEALHQDLRADPQCNIKLTMIYPFLVRTGLYNVKDLHIKYPKLIPILEPKYVAEYTMNAQRRDMFETTAPRFLLTIWHSFRLLPFEIIGATFDFFDTFIKPEVKEKN